MAKLRPGKYHDARDLKNRIPVKLPMYDDNKQGRNFDEINRYIRQHCCRMNWSSMWMPEGQYTLYLFESEEDATYFRLRYG